MSGSILTAIFGSLPAGEYVVWEDDEPPRAATSDRRPRRGRRSADAETAPIAE